MISVVSICALLTACGGGSSNSDDAVTKDPVDRYAGSYVTACDANNPWVKDAATGVELHTKLTITTLPKLTANKIPVKHTYTVYDKDDCSGAARLTVHVSGSNTWWNLDGTVTLDGRVVDKITHSEDAKFPGITSAGPVTLNGVTFNAKFGKAYVGKDLMYLSGSDLYSGDFDKPFDAQGYPSALESQPSLKKL